MNKKLEGYLKNLALSWMPFGAIKAGWDSSAQNLEKDLESRGIKLPIKLYYQYALPQSMTPSDFMMRIAVLHLCADFSMFSKVHSEIFLDKNLKLVEKLRLVKYIASMRRASREQLREYVRFIKFANPKELSELTVQNATEEFELLSGVTFGFGPDEIEYYMKKEERDLNKREENEAYRKLKRLLGYEPQYDVVRMFEDFKEEMKYNRFAELRCE